MSDNIKYTAVYKRIFKLKISFIYTIYISAVPMLLALIKSPVVYPVD